MEPRMTIVHGLRADRRAGASRGQLHGAAAIGTSRPGAELLSLVNDDENKVFGVAFRTPPPDSTGLPHILEHSVLCGSRKYPVKDPFIQLAKGSLNTFLNAMTYPDKTVYPTASQNLQDFYNLVDVYLDAVFHPRITPEVLKQEGWHYELDAPDAPITYKGVVFNEMKGVYSSPDALLSKLSQESLFPDNEYGVDSGGDPQAHPRPDLRRLQGLPREVLPSLQRAPLLLRRRRSGRAPAPARRATCGEFDRAEIDAPVALQPRFAAPKRLARTFPASDDGGQGHDVGQLDARRDRRRGAATSGSACSTTS